MSERPVVLEVEGVTKRFGAVTALYDVSLQLRSGEVLGIIGDNGAGKSTLVGVVSGALKPDEGRIVVDGVERSFTDPAEANSDDACRQEVVIDGNRRHDNVAELSATLRRLQV